MRRRTIFNDAPEVSSNASYSGIDRDCVRFGSCNRLWPDNDGSRLRGVARRTSGARSRTENAVGELPLVLGTRSGLGCGALCNAQASSLAHLRASRNRSDVGGGGVRLLARKITRYFLGTRS